MQQKNPGPKKTTSFRGTLASLWTKITAAFWNLVASFRKLWGSKPVVSNTASQQAETSLPETSTSREVLIDQPTEKSPLPAPLSQPSPSPPLAPETPNQETEQNKQFFLKKKLGDLGLEFTPKGFKSSVEYSGNDISLTLTPQAEPPITTITQETMQDLKQKIQDLTLEFSSKGFETSSISSGNELKVTIKPQTGPRKVYTTEEMEEEDRQRAKANAMLQRPTTREARETGPRAGHAKTTYALISDLLEQTDLLVELQICSTDKINSIKEKAALLNKILTKYLEDGTNPLHEGEEMLKKLPQELWEFLETTFETCVRKLGETTEINLTIGQELDTQYKSPIRLIRAQKLDTKARTLVEARKAKDPENTVIYQIGDAKALLTLLNDMSTNIELAKNEIATQKQNAANKPPVELVLDAPKPATATSKLNRAPDKRTSKLPPQQTFDKNFDPSRREARIAKWKKQLSEICLTVAEKSEILSIMTLALDSLATKENKRIFSHLTDSEFALQHKNLERLMREAERFKSTKEYAALSKPELPAAPPATVAEPPLATVAVATASPSGPPAPAAENPILPDWIEQSFQRMELSPGSHLTLKPAEERATPKAVEPPVPPPTVEVATIAPSEAAVDTPPPVGELSDKDKRIKGWEEKLQKFNLNPKIQALLLEPMKRALDGLSGSEYKDVRKEAIKVTLESIEGDLSLYSTPPFDLWGTRLYDLKCWLRDTEKREEEWKRNLRKHKISDEIHNAVVNTMRKALIILPTGEKEIRVVDQLERLEEILKKNYNDGVLQETIVYEASLLTGFLKDLNPSPTPKPS